MLEKRSWESRAVARAPSASFQDQHRVNDEQPAAGRLACAHDSVSVSANREIKSQPHSGSHHAPE